MKCCKKFVAVAVLVALGIGGLSLVKHGWSEVASIRWSKWRDKQIAPEVRLERVKVQISKLDQDIDKNWTPIATREHEIKDLKKDLETKTAKLATIKDEMLAAAKDLEAKVQKVKYNGKDYNPADARKVLDREVSYYKSLSSEVDSKGKLAAAWQKELNAMMAQQDEMKKLRGDLEVRVAQIETDLKVLRLAQTKSKLPAGDLSRLDDIKVTLSELEKNNEIQMRALQLRETHSRGENVTDTAKTADANDDLISKIKAVTGESGKDADDVGGK